MSPQYGAGFGFGTKAHPSAHIEICGGRCNAGDGPTDKQVAEIFFPEALSPQFARHNSLWRPASLDRRLFTNPSQQRTIYKFITYSVDKVLN
jgi:hypothetical protein